MGTFKGRKGKEEMYLESQKEFKNYPQNQDT